MDAPNSILIFKRQNKNFQLLSYVSRPCACLALLRPPGVILGLNSFAQKKTIDSVILLFPKGHTNSTVKAKLMDSLNEGHLYSPVPIPPTS